MTEENKLHNTSLQNQQRSNCCVQEVDINEDYIDADVLNKLLKDHTLSTKKHQVNIFWATDDYAELGEGYGYSDEITPEKITGKHNKVIRPRSVKSREQQQVRSKNMAEVFTPCWICNKQNNLIDNEWFGTDNVFNTEIDLPDGTHHWETTPHPIIFPDGKTWLDYVKLTRLEITCGEAPYLVSRYDGVTGEPIPVSQRIGLLDRKLRVISENTHVSGEWLKAARKAFKSIYGYEWQGDNLVLARENLLYTFIDFYFAKFGKMPLKKSLESIAYIVSWNIFQMDGLKGVVPDSCGKTINEGIQSGLFGNNEENPTKCRGCSSGNIRQHNGTYVLIRDWTVRNKDKQKIKFIDLIKL